MRHSGRGLSVVRPQRRGWHLRWYFEPAAQSAVRGTAVTNQSTSAQTELALRLRCLVSGHNNHLEVSFSPKERGAYAVRTAARTPPHLAQLS